MLRVTGLLLIASCAPPRGPAERDTGAAAEDGADDSGLAGDSASTEDSGGAPPEDTDSGGSGASDGRDGALLGDQAGGAAGAAGTLAVLELDGDGRDELVIGAPGARDGRVWVIAAEALAAPEALASTVATVTLVGRFAGWLAPYRGDADGDGVEDLVVGRGESLVPGVGSEGAVYLLAGGAALAEAASLIDARAEIAGQYADDLVRFGALGDLDGDGLADLIAGASQADDGSWEWSGSGCVSIWLEGGPTGARTIVDADDRIFGTWFELGLGATLASGDLDGDGYADLLVGAPEWETALGVVAVVPGDGAGDWPHQIEAAATTLVYGSAEASSLGLDPPCAPGDLDADGARDLVLGSSASGGVWLWSGVPAGVTGPGSADVHIVGEPGSFGAALACDGDLDGDGADDLLVGDPLADGVGAVHRFLSPLGGAATLTPGDADGRERGDAAGDQLGAAVLALGDPDGDGVESFAVGAPGADAGAADAGAVYLFSAR